MFTTFLVSYAAVLRVVKQRSALRHDPKNGCVEDWHILKYPWFPLRFCCSFSSAPLLKRHLRANNGSPATQIIASFIELVF